MSSSTSLGHLFKWPKLSRIKIWTHKSMIIEFVVNTQNSEIIEIFELNNLKLTPIERRS